jgi:hypothetical protein
MYIPRQEARGRKNSEFRTPTQILSALSNRQEQRLFQKIKEDGEIEICTFFRTGIFFQNINQSLFLERVV